MIFINDEFADNIDVPISVDADSRKSRAIKVRCDESYMHVHTPASGMMKVVAIIPFLAAGSMLMRVSSSRIVA